MSEILTREYVLETCKLGQGAACCRYLVAGAEGFECAKLGSLRAGIDRRVGIMVAKGDNCEGKA